MKSFSEFYEGCSVKKQESNGLFTVFMDGKSRLGAIYDCKGNTQFEVIENAYDYYTRLSKQLAQED